MIEGPSREFPATAPGRQSPINCFQINRLIAWPDPGRSASRRRPTPPSRLPGL